MSRVLHVLIIEDRPSDATLEVDALRKAGFELDWQRVETPADYLACLNNGIDVILADYNLPQFDAPEALRLLNERNLDIPFIVVTGTVSEEAAVECMKQGAADYLLKDRMTRLGPAVASALEVKSLRDKKRQAEAQLRQNEERFRLLFDYSPIAICIARDGLRLYVNQAYLRMFGYTDMAEVVGTAELMHFPAQAHEELRQWLGGRVPGQAVPIALDTVGQRTDGSRFPLHIESAHLDLADGPAHVTYLLDVSERRLLEEEMLNAELLRVELEQEKELTGLKERFTSMVSHEFRTPLTVIRIVTELLERSRNRLSEAQSVKYLHDILDQVKYMVQLLDDILLFSKNRAGKVAFNPILTDVDTLCRSIFEPLQLADANAHQFVFLNHCEVKAALLDERLLRHVLGNLLSNAAKYSPSGGEVRMAVSSDDKHLIFRISDQGIGIPIQDQTHLFEPFHRASNVSVIQGTGLGLAIVKVNVEAHGGKVTFESIPDRGTTFTVHLPLALDAAQDNAHHS